MKTQVWIAFAVAASVSIAACASRSEPAKPAAPSAPAAAARSGAAGSNILSKVTVGMTKAQVKEVVGAPSDENSYESGKRWIPWYYGNDVRRTTWFYKGQGRVVFSDGNVFGGGGSSVQRVEIDTSESGVAR
jgi:outer membrane protein assembly factor BamE (lipoprotein component of BamABCDE complex)